MTAPRRDYAVSLDTIVDGLRQSIDALVEKILPNAVKDGHEWFVGSLAGEKGRSMAINRKGRPGVWQDFASSEGGDALDLVAGVLFRGDKKEAIKWAKSWLGLDGDDPERIKTFRRQAEAHARTRANEDRQQEDKMRDAAGRIWRGAAHRIKGTPADAYLVGRGIDFAELGKQSGSLAFSAKCWCSETNGPLPALVAEIRRGREFVGIHRTYLDDAFADGVVRKARLREAKKTLGRYVGGCIPLWRGLDPRKWAQLWEEGGADEVVVLAEGIENALSVVMADQSFRVAATVSLANMAAVELPPCVKEVIIARDNDAEGSKADIAFGRAVEAHRAAGRRVREARAPAPHKDFNDWLVALRAGAAQSSGG